MTSYWIILPGAGIGARMGGNVPKQYLMLGNKTIAMHTVEKFLSFDCIAGVVIVHAAQDQYWKENLPLIPNGKEFLTVIGGKNRSDSVKNALEKLESKVKPSEWVWVHDLVRPFISNDEVIRLSNSLQKINESHTCKSDLDLQKESSYDGLILALPCEDTLKFISSDKSHLDLQRNLNRSEVLRAQTPQIFRHKALLHAINESYKQGVDITDEASAMSSLGGKVFWEHGSDINIKITNTDHLSMAQYLSEINKLNK